MCIMKHEIKEGFKTVEKQNHSANIEWFDVFFFFFNHWNGLNPSETVHPTLLTRMCARILNPIRWLPLLFCRYFTCVNNQLTVNHWCCWFSALCINLCGLVQFGFCFYLVRQRGPTCIFLMWRRKTMDASSIYTWFECVCLTQIQNMNKIFFQNNLGISSLFKEFAERKFLSLNAANFEVFNRLMANTFLFLHL